MLKIRLRRMGAIRQPHYRVVVADARSPRDGRFIENLGHYNPLTNPATIQIDVAKYEEWKKKGAQPTDAVASLVKQFNRTQRRAAEAGGDAAAVAKPDARTRLASGKRAEPKVEAAPAEDTATATMQDTPAEEADAPMNEAGAEASRDGGEGSEALTGGVASEGTQGSDVDIAEAADTGASANPGAATEESAG